MKYRPTSPLPVSSKEIGSGTAPGGSAPGTLSPASPPNEKIALVTVVSEVTPERPVMWNVALPLRKGLCGLFPAIDPLAALYVPPASGGPMIKCEGPVTVPSTFN
jgi:hypothetical protein